VIGDKTEMPIFEGQTMWHCSYDSVAAVFEKICRNVKPTTHIASNENSKYSKIFRSGTISHVFLLLGGKVHIGPMLL